MEPACKDPEIENLTIDLAITMDKIQYIDGLLKYCSDPVTIDKYVTNFDNEMNKLYDIKAKLTKLLLARIDREKLENLPINMGYRLLYKELGRF